MRIVTMKTCDHCGKIIINDGNIKQGQFRRKYHKECAYAAYQIKKKDYYKKNAEKFKEYMKEVRSKYKEKKHLDVIYFVRSSNGLIKIGITSNLKIRFANLQSSSPVKLELLYYYTPKNKSEEKELHDKFILYKSNISSHHVEWFHESTLIYETIEELKKNNANCDLNIKYTKHHGVNKNKFYQSIRTQHLNRKIYALT